VWDGNTPLHEWTYDEKDRPKTLTDEYGLKQPEGTEPTENITTWVFEEGSFRPAAKLTDDKKYSIITDYLGTPVQMYDEKGTLTWEARLDIYGKVATFAGRSLSDCPFRYQGQYEDSETGLYYNRFRYYSPEEGMYLSKDPICLAGGMKAYSYALNPTIRLDVFGLFHHNDTGHNVYGLYDVVGQDAMGNDILADKPYYVGITNDPDLRATQHGTSGRLGDNSRMRVLDENLTYGQARGYEQAYIEHYGTKTGTVGEEISVTNRGNKINSFDVDNKTRARDRHQSFVDNRQSKLNELNSKSIRCH
jgi:RHS repeat-associated protein